MPQHRDMSCKRKAESHDVGPALRERLDPAFQRFRARLVEANIFMGAMGGHRVEGRTAMAHSGKLLESSAREKYFELSFRTVLQTPAAVMASLPKAELPQGFWKLFIGGETLSLSLSANCLGRDAKPMIQLG